MRAIAAREDVAELILDAADRLLARYGYKKMTIDDIAREVGIGKGTVYLHFPSKEEIVLSHVDRIVRRLLERLRVIAAGDAPAAGRIRRMLIERVTFRFDSVQHYTESISDVLRDLRAGLLARRERHFEQEAALFAEVLEQGRRAGALRRTDAPATAHALLLATNALLPFSLSVQELGDREEIEERAARIADLLVNGLALPKAATRRATR